MLPVYVGARQQPAHQPVSRVVPTQKNQPIGLMRIGWVFQPNIRSYDGLQSSRTGRLVELNHPEKIAEVGNGHGRHAMTNGGFYQIVRSDDAIGQRKLGMDV